MMFKTRALAVALATLLGIAPLALYGQADEAAKNTEKARAALNAMVQALGGDAWLHVKNQLLVGQIAAFYQGRPDPGTTKVFQYHAWPDKDRIEVTKHRDVVQLYAGREGWEVTFRGKKPMEKDILDDYLRRRDHSIETVVKVWMKDQNTILLYEGQHMAERHLADQVTLISSENDSVTILMDSQTHLPLERIFQWRDPVYHDKNTEKEEYATYRPVNGIQTPYTITRSKNGEESRQFYVTDVKYNQDLGGDFWNPEEVAKRIEK
jgi:hypothetical protein